MFLAIYWNLIRKIWQSGNFFVFEIWRIWAFFPRKILVFSGWNLAKFCTKKKNLPTQFLHSDISHNLGICFIEPEKGMKSVKKSLSTMWMRFCSWMLACLFFSPSSMIFFPANFAKIWPEKLWFWHKGLSMEKLGQIGQISSFFFNLNFF